jgi:hypothetical protein
MISIKHKFTGATLCEFDVKTIRKCAETGRADLRGADLRGANLREANLYGANLCGANLYGANLCGASIDGETVKKNPIQIPCGLHYVALITDNYMRLGCKRFTHDEWVTFSDDEISTMDDDALEFWQQWKEPLLAMCKAHASKVEK